MAFLSDTKNKNTTDDVFPKKKVRLLFVGDMMFDRWIRETSARKNTEFIFSGVEELLSGKDLVVGNLEGPITDQASVSVGSEIGSRENYVFTFPPETAEMLREKNIRLVNLGNNHILNFGEKGLEGTKKYLIEAGVNFFGNAGENREVKRFWIENIGGIRIGFLNYNQFAKNPEDDISDDLAAMKEIKPDFTVVYTHWGTEYAPTPDEKEKKLAHEFIDQGADFVIGSHPHVVQEKEEYKGKMIYYSLGNFIFDQYFRPDTQKGEAVEVELEENKIPVFYEHEVDMRSDGRTVSTQI